MIGDRHPFFSRNAFAARCYYITGDLGILPCTKMKVLDSGGVILQTSHLRIRTE